MIVRVDDDGTVRLLEADDLRRFSIAMPDTAAARSVLATVARPEGREHAWIAPNRVRSLAGSPSSSWNDDFAKMVDYATSKGWTDTDGALRAHIIYD